MIRRIHQQKNTPLIPEAPIDGTLRGPDDIFMRMARMPPFTGMWSANTGVHSSMHGDIALPGKAQAVSAFACHRTPGFGDSNRTDIISELHQAAFQGSIAYKAETIQS